MSEITTQKRLQDMTTAELRVELGEAGVEVPSGAKKELLLTLAKTAREGSEAGVVVAEEDEMLEERAAEARHLPAVRESEALVARAEITPDEVAAQRDKIKQVMEAVMTKGVHYGEIPGVNKPTLLKPGAEVLCVTLRLAPSYQSEKTFHGDGHLTVVSKATLTHIPTGLVIAEGEGLCSTMEKKYAYRGEGRTCPACGAAGTIKKSKYPPRESDYPGAKRSDPPGWYCYAKAGGCGANFAASDTVIVDQSAEKVPNPDLPDTWNTVLKMGNKRALIAATLNGTAASDIFTQDVEDAGTAAADTHEYVGDVGGDAHDEALAAEEERARQFGGDRQTGTWHGPTGWKELADRFIAALGEKEAPEWLGQLAELYRFSSIGEIIASDEVTQERKEDLWRRLNTTLHALEDEGEVQLTPNARELVRKTFEKGFDGIMLKGPDWPLTPTEAEAAAGSQDAPAEQAAAQESDSPATAEPGEPEVAPEAEDTPAATEQPTSPEDDDIPDH